MREGGGPAFPDARVLLERHGLRAKKHFGQNFLTSERVFRAIVAAAGDGNSQLVANVGTGGEITVLELARTVVELCGGASPIQHAPQRAGEILKSRARVDRLRDALEQPTEHQTGTAVSSGRMGTHSSPKISGSA